MPRLPRGRTLALLAAGAVVAAVPPAELHGDLASAAGTLFEAAPFVLVGALVARLAEPRGGRFARLVPLLGCGCGELPGALALPAIAVCWLTFGPWVALGRVAAGAAMARIGDVGRRLQPSPRRAGGAGSGRSESGVSCDAAVREHGSDPLRELTAIVPAAIAGPVLAAALAHVGSPDALLHASRGVPNGRPVPAALGPVIALALDAAEFGAGALIGAIVPCATASVALAASLRVARPAAAAGLLATGGVVRLGGALGDCAHRLGLWMRPRSRSDGTVSRASRARYSALRGIAMSAGAPSADARLALVTLATALAALAMRGPSGLISSRLVPIEALGAAAAVWLALRRERTAAFAAPTLGAALLAALMMGSPEPNAMADATTLDTAWAGERLTFIGTAHRSGNTTILERFAITCCRIDATAVAVRLAHRIPVADGTWVGAIGKLDLKSGDSAQMTSDGQATSTSALELWTTAWHLLPIPADPFIYR